MNKNWYASKTLWFNAIAFGVAVLGPVLAGQGYTGEVGPELGIFVPAAAALINVVLRYFFTNQGLRE